MRYNQILTIAAITFLLVGCHHQSTVTQSDGAKLQYSPEINEVEVVTLARQPFQMQIIANGKLSAEQKSALYFPQSGQISALNCANGAFVSKGAIIARLDDSVQRSALENASIELQRARLEYLDVLAGLGYMVTDSTSIPQDVKDLAGIRSGYRSAQNSYSDALRNLEGTVLRAPFSGKVADLKLKKWDRTDAEPFCTLIADQRFDVTFSALESEYSFLQNGQAVKVTLFGRDDEPVSGSIRSINPTIDCNGQIAVTASIPGGHGMLDGMNAKVVVEKTISDQLVVPKRAVVIRDGLEVLFRYNGGRAEWVYVNVLNANSEAYAIQANSGRGAELREGDQIIISGNLNLADGSVVTLKQ